MKYIELKDINEYKSESINPAKMQETIFELYSVPVYETGHPEYLTGKEIASSKILVRKNDILLCKINPRINRVWIVRKESENINIASSEWIVVRSNKYNPEFLAWYFRSPKFRQLMVSEVTGIGGSLTRAQPKRVAKYPVPIMDRIIQDKIVYRLNKIQKIIDMKKKELLKLDSLIQSRFVELFGDPIMNTKGWNVVTIKDIVTEVRYGTSKPAIEGGQYPYLRMNNLTSDGHLDLKDLKYIDIPDEEIEKCIVRKGDVLFNRTNSIDLVGKTAVFDLLEDMVIAGYIIRIRLNEKLLPEVFSQYMNLKALKNVLRAMAKGAVNQANINAQELQSIKVYLPDMDIQKQFIKIKDQIDKSKFEVQKSLEKTQLLFDSLMQKYFG